ncbi:MAG: hypothetical protein Q8K32_29505 [Archangium sp.]|nr:hypothetical protein [Archangium sp.]
MTRKVLLPVLPTLMLMAGLWFGIESCDRTSAADRIPSAVWVATPEGARLVVHEQIDRSSDTGSWTVDRMVAIDPQTGVVGEPWFVKFDGDEQVVLQGTRGRSLWFQAGKEFFVVPTVGGVLRPLRSLAAQYPVVPAPWYSVNVDSEGLVRVEADDRSHWHIDVSTQRAEKDASAPVGWRPSTQWAGASGRLGFVDVPTQRHSDQAHFALAPVDEYGGLAGAPLESRFESPRFLGQEVIEVRGCAVVAERASVTCLDRSGARGWSWAVPEGAVTQWAAWPFEEGALVRSDRRFTLLSREGQVRWTLLR